MYPVNYGTTAVHCLMQHLFHNSSPPGSHQGWGGPARSIAAHLSAATFSLSLLGGALHLVDFLTALVELEGGHALDPASRRGLLVLVDVHLDEDHRARVRRVHLLKDGR